jgi:putative FmdB family regulatory protein
MPLYEYECARTKKRFEVIQRFSDAPLTQCLECDQHPECSGEVTKILSAPAIKFKGAGWYVNDYGKGGKLPATESKSESKSEKTPETKSESKKTESKPAATSD